MTHERFSLILCCVMIICVCNAYTYCVPCKVCRKNNTRLAAKCKHCDYAKTTNELNRDRWMYAGLFVLCMFTLAGYAMLHQG